MGKKLSSRLQEIVDALPIKPGMRILEIGCGPGAMAREMALRVGKGFVLGIDRSAKAIKIAKARNIELENPKNLSFRHVTVENFELLPNEKKFDLVVAIRVGALDGRHPKIEQAAKEQIKKAIKLNGHLYIDGGKPLKKLRL